jgi:hypothetical protein
MNGVIVLSAVALGLGVTPEDESWGTLRARIEVSPQDVAAFIERRAGCNHFWGEVGSDNPDREQQIQDTLREMRCWDLETDERALRKAHHYKAEVVKLLDDTADLMPW